MKPVTSKSVFVADARCASQLTGRSTTLSKKRLAVVAFALTASVMASAQVRPAMVRSIDEPGRVPYSEEVRGTCSVISCSFSFTPVPAGKRLVIEHVAGSARSSSTSTVYSDAELVTNSTVTPGFGVRFPFRMSLLNLAGSTNAYNGYYFNSPVKAYVEAAQSPRISMFASTEGPTVFSQATISGYLVDVAP